MTIGVHPFSDCIGLTSIEVESGNTFYDSRNNCNAIIETRTNKLIAGCQSTVIPNTVTSIGDYAFDGCSGLISVIIPNSVTSIENYAFYYCSGLTSVIIPNSVTSIGAYAFYECRGLTSVTIPNSVTSIGDHAFYECRGMTSVTIPNSVTSIGAYAFYECRGLTSVTIPNSVTSIGDSAFIWCTSLTSVTIPNSVTSIGEHAFFGCWRIKEIHSLIEQPFAIEPSVFQYLDDAVRKFTTATLYVPAGTKAKYQTTDGWKNFTNIVEEGGSVPADNITFADANVKAICVQHWDTNGDGELSKDEAAAVTDLGEVFKNNTDIQSFDELQYFTGLKSIRERAFLGCSNLISVTIGNSVESIGLGAFQKCWGLTSVTIPTSVTNIEVVAFDGCSGLTSIVVESDNSVYDSRDNCNAIIKTETNELIAGCKYTVIPTSVTTIGWYAFSDCLGLTSVSIPTSVTSIGRDAFFNCTDLTSVTIPYSVSSIGVEAFGECSSLTSVSIPNSVTSIGRHAFSGCSSIKEVHSLIEQPYAIEPSVFQYVENNVTKFTTATLYVPAGTKTKYQATDGWKNFANIVEEGGSASADNITFADANVKAICVWNWDTNKDGYLSKTEAAAVTDLGEVFKNDTDIQSFDELQYFTGLTIIGEEAFRGCIRLTSVTIPTSVTSLGKNAFRNCRGLTSVIIPNSVTSIGYGVFGECSSLTSITIPNSVTSIGENAFRESGLTSFIIPNSVTIIEGFAFSDCSSLTSVTIPNSVTSIGDYAFYNCSRLGDVYSQIEKPFAINPSAFQNSVYGSDVFTDATLHIPEGTKGKYMATEGWKEFANIFDVTLIINGDMEGTDVSCFFYKVQRGDIMPGVITNGVGVNGSRGIMVAATAKERDSYDNQFWIRMNKPVKAGTKYRFSFDYRADKNASIDIELHTEPGEYICNKYSWGLECTAKWKHFIAEGVVSSSDSPEATPFRAVALDLSTFSAANNYYFDKVMFEIVSPDVEPAEEIITFEDSEVKAICVANWDTNGDGELSKDEAAAVDYLGEVFKNNQKITHFNELQFFTGIKTIREEAFFECKNLRSITFPSSIEIIEGKAFSSCYELRSLTIPRSVMGVGEQIVSYCHSLASIKVEDGNSVYDSRNNCNAIIESKTNTLIAGCKNTMIPNDVTKIGDGAFISCGFTTITIPNSVTSIGSDAFQGCALESITIPSSVTSISKDAFSYCSMNSIIVESGNIYYDSRDNCNAIIETRSNKLIKGCENTVIPNTVTIIGSKAFADLGFTSIAIPNSVTSIGEQAFCQCILLQSITIPNSVKSIEDRAFYRCYSLQEINSLIVDPFPIFDVFDKYTPTLYVPIGTKAKYQAMEGWKYFSTIEEKGGSVPANNITFADTNVKAICVANWDTNKDGELSKEEAATVTDLGEVFRGNRDIQSFDELQYFTGLTTIGEHAFHDCRGLTSITLPNSVTTIGFGAFWYCESLTSLVIPGSVKTIDQSAIFVCRSLTSITIPKSVTSIGIQNLNYCNNLTTVKVESGNTVYDSRNNCNAIIETKTNTLIAGCKGTTIPSTVTAIGRIAFQGSDLTTITIPNSVTSIGSSCFLACKKLTTITIPSSVTTLGGTLFYGCEVLSTIKVESGNTVYDSRDNCNAIIEKKTNTLVAGCKNTIIPSTVTSIGANAFRSCYGLTSITIPNSVKSIEEGAFQDCTGLKEVHSLIEKPFAIGMDVFQYDDNGETKFTSAILYVPSGMKSKYQTTDGWKNFTNIVEEGGETPVVDNITFADATVKAICVEKWDTNGDGELSRDEAAAVKDLGLVFEYSSIKTFDELQYFTGLTSIGADAFHECERLTSIVIPNSAKSIESSAFWQCRKLTSVTIPNSVVTIANGAFMECSNLPSITIPNSVTTIRSGAFYLCNSLTSVSIGSSVTSIEDGAFLQTNILSVIWNSKANLTQAMINAFKENRYNMLIYVTDESVLPQTGMNNVVVNGTAQYVVLTENSPFYNAQAFTAKTIMITHNFQMETGKGSAAGWETISLPFDVTKYTHETKGDLLPFARYTTGSNSKPFWLCELSSTGFKRAQGIEANKPYIISMPNNSAYSSEYCLNGRVTFLGTDVTVKKSDEDDLTGVIYNGMTFKPTYSKQSKGNAAYAINATNNYSTSTGGKTAGSVFIQNLRDVRPFEAYFETGSAAAREFVPIDFADDAVTGLEEVLYGIKSNSADGIRIYNMAGQLVRKSNEKTINEATKGLPSGIYVINGKKTILTLQQK